jgi:hypothetical protein
MNGIFDLLKKKSFNNLRNESKRYQICLLKVAQGVKPFYSILEK